MKIPYSPAEIDLIGRLCADGYAMSAICDRMPHRTEASIRSVVRKHGWRIKRGKYATRVFRDKPPARKPRTRGTQAPKPLPPEMRSQYPVNFAAHSRWLKW